MRACVRACVRVRALIRRMCSGYIYAYTYTCVCVCVRARALRIYTRTHVHVHTQVMEQLRELEAGGMHAGWATRTLNRLQMMSPTSLRISFTLLRRGASAGLDECIRTEWRLAHRTWADLNEGVRAFEKDKDGASLARTSQRGRQRQREEGVRLRQRDWEHQT